MRFLLDKGPYISSQNSRSEAELLSKNDAVSNLSSTFMAHLVWSDLTVRVKTNGTQKGAKLLDSISGCVGPNELLALMGPSGSGKVTTSVPSHNARASPVASVRRRY